MEYKIDSEKKYHETMIVIYDMMNKGVETLDEQDTEKLIAMTVAAEKFEDVVLGLKPAKRQSDVPFLKAIYNELNLYPKFILDHI